MPTIRVATFNVENLFARFKFNRDIDPARAVRDGWDVNKTYFTIFEEEAKKITASAIRATKADIIALQEVENLDTLKRFRREYLGGPAAYPYAVAIDGNDLRLIDIAVLSRHPIVHVRSNQHLRTGRSYLFSRDCLELTVEVDGRPLHLFVNHLKSMLDRRDPANGRRNTRERRRSQAKAVRSIVTARLGSHPERKPFIILGDLNDYLETDEFGETAIADLVRWDAVENVVDRLAQEQRWSHYFAGRRVYHQLDYILPSRALAQRITSDPEFVRRGLPKKAKRFAGPWFKGVGNTTPKASDHCPLVVEFEL
jgi:endonuclease/exonuclease/phosphatase family metal-dependent hydrolase